MAVEGRSSEKATVGVVGVGTMGRGFVRNLRLADFPIVCFDISSDALAGLEAERVDTAESPAAVASRSQIVLTMLPSKDEVRAAILGTDGVLEGSSSGDVLAEMSTIEPAVMMEIADAAGAVDVDVIDGGVSASPKMNWYGQGTLMVGGQEEAFDRARPALQALCSDLLYTGALGSAKVAKLINNLMGGVSMATVSEAFTMGMLSGVEPSVLYSGMMGSWAKCAVLERMPPVAELRPAEQNDEQFPDFHIRYMAKDLASAIEAATGVGAGHVMASAAHQLFSAAADMGHGGEPIWRLMEALSTSEEA